MFACDKMFYGGLATFKVFLLVKHLQNIFKYFAFRFFDIFAPLRGLLCMRDTNKNGVPYLNK